MRSKVWSDRHDRDRLRLRRPLTSSPPTFRSGARRRPAARPPPPPRRAARRVVARGPPALGRSDPGRVVRRRSAATSVIGPVTGSTASPTASRPACPRCGSIARDRFLMWCFIAAHPIATRGPRSSRPARGSAPSYRSFMRTWFDYRASDFDLSAHAGDIKLDLQDDRPAHGLAGRRPDAARARARTGHDAGAGRALPRHRARWPDVPPGAAAARAHPRAERTGVPRRQHARVLQLRVGPHRPAAMPPGSPSKSSSPRGSDAWLAGDAPPRRATATDSSSSRSCGRPPRRPDRHRRRRPVASAGLPPALPLRHVGVPAALSAHGMVRLVTSSRGSSNSATP